MRAIVCYSLTDMADQAHGILVVPQARVDTRYDGQKTLRRVDGKTYPISGSQSLIWQLG